MKKLFALSAMIILFLISCTSSPEDQAKYSIQTYLKVNLKPQDNYNPLSFSKIDSLSIPDTMTNNHVAYYKVNHTYTVVNDLKEEVKMTVDFYLDKELKVLGANTNSLTENE